MKYILIVFSFIYTFQIVFCQERTQILPNTFNLQLDQDVFHPLNEDRNYTMGISFEFELNCLENNFVYKGLKALNNTLSLNYSNNYLLNSISLGFTGFTPDSLGTVSIVEGDRPYSNISRLTIGVKKINIKGTGNNRFGNPKRSFTFSYSQASLGILGLDLARSVQSEIHRVLNSNYEDTLNYSNPVKPYGWNNQISNGGGLVGLLTYGSKILITRKQLNYLTNIKNNELDWQGKREKSMFLDRVFEASAGYELMVGYYNNLQINTQLRLGALDPTNWFFSNSTNGGLNKRTDLISFREEGRNQNKPNRKIFELYIFTDIAANYMIYNTLLRGQYVDFLKFGSESKYTLNSNEVENLFIEFKLGINLRLFGLNLSYIPISLRTSEINTIEYYERTHRWSEFSIKLNI